MTMAMQSQRPIFSGRRTEAMGNAIVEGWRKAFPSVELEFTPTTKAPQLSIVSQDDDVFMSASTDPEIPFGEVKEPVEPLEAQVDICTIDNEVGEVD